MSSTFLAIHCMRSPPFVEFAKGVTAADDASPTSRSAPGFSMYWHAVAQGFDVVWFVVLSTRRRRTSRTDGQTLLNLRRFVMGERRLPDFQR